MKMSEQITKIAGALTSFNSEVTQIKKDAKNPFFKSNYATLDHIVEEVRPILNKFGLNILQIPGGDTEGNVIMKTILLHESGEFIESDELTMKPVKNDPQAVGSCITYARRYSLGSILSLSTGEDDDGNGAMQPTKPKTDYKPKSTTKPTNITTNTKDAEYKCSDCNTDIKQGVHAFSTSKYGQALCLACQKKVK